MARKYSNKKRMKKIEPAVMTLSFQLTSAPFQVNTTDFIDLSQVASIVNRRFYRQGINWAVGGFKVMTSAGYKGQVLVSKLPNSWTMSNAWEKGFRAYMRMNKEALEENESVRPRFLDFKVYADAQHAQKGVAANLMPYNFDPSVPALNVASPGEWEMSKVVVPFGPASPGNTTDFELIATGASFPGAGASGADSVSLIEGYAASRGLPEIKDPNTPDDASDADGSTPENWLTALFNKGTDQDSEVLGDLITENNQAPYPFENAVVGGVTITDTQYPGGANQLPGMQIHSIELVSTTTVGGTTRIKGGNFPCGLIAINQFQQGEGGPFSALLEIDLVPGHHRGYLCEPMTEM